MMRSSVGVALGLLLAAAPAWADVTVTAQVTGRGKAAPSEAVTYIKGLKMRSDSTLGDQPTSTIMDLEAQKFITINHKKKEATVYNFTEFREILEKGTKGAAPVTSFKPNGQTREIAGRSCTGYDVMVNMPMALGGDSSMTMQMSGPVFIAKGAPGSADYAKFYRAAAEKGFIFSDPRAAKAQPQQAQGMAEMYKAIADTGGIPFAIELGMKVEGGPMAGMMNKVIGGIAFATTVSGVSTDAVAADKFDVPAGYAVKDGK
jgi:hypothetical protein